MFSVWNLRYSPTAWHFAQPGRVGTVSLVCLVQSPAAPHGLNITFHRSRALDCGTTQRRCRGLAARETARLSLKSCLHAARDDAPQVP